MSSSSETDIVKVLQENLGAEITETTIQRPERIYVKIKTACHKRAISRLITEGYALSAITGLDLGGNLELDYHLRHASRILTIKMPVSIENPATETITDIMPSATLFEREIHDLFGIDFKGHPNLERLELPDSWPSGEHPLRKNWVKSEQPIDYEPEPIEVENSDGSINLVFGPQHPALHESEMFLFKLNGEHVVDVKPRLGYCHRGIEKLSEQKTFLQDVYLTERICGICNVAHSMCFCHAVEEIGGFEIPSRAKYLRSILSELSRIH
ncbi:MAG: hypothetical protein QG670_2460, partial [Thermoproteota archaeon]|nr:hypothetical protein [Thermoproteota archaeon]